MSRKLTDKEKLQRKARREARSAAKEAFPTVDKYGAKIMRILREEAPSNPGVKYNSEYFEKRFEVSNITILRAIKKLKLNNLIKERQVRGSYAIEEEYYEDFYSSSFSQETKKNIALIASLGGVLQQYKNTPLYDSVTDLIYFLQPEIAKSDRIFSSGRVIVSPQMEYDVNAQNWEKVYAALQENHKLRFRYTKPYTNNKIRRTVRPYQLVLDNGSVYLFAYSEHAGAVLLYDLSYMADIVMLKEKFRLPKKYDISNYSGGGRLGAFTGDKIYKFKIRFTGYAKLWMKNHKLADDQTFKEKDDATVVSFSSSQFEKVLKLVLSWGQQAEPLSPVRLVKFWKEEVLAMAEKVKEK